MNILKKWLIAVMILGLSVPPAYADIDSIAEIKAMMEELRSDYESKIGVLQKKVEELEANQEVKVKKQVEQKVAQIREEIKEEIKEETLHVEYVGRGNAPVGEGGLVVHDAPGLGTVSLGGYYDMEYKDLNNAESTFRQHRWIISIGAQPHERILFNSELEIEYGGPDVPAGDGELKVEQAYADFLINDWVNMRAGIVLSPFGRYNAYHDSDQQDLTDRPLMARDIVPTTWSEAGYGFFGEFNPTIGEYEDLLLDYEVYVVNGLDDGFSDTGLRSARNSFKTDNNDNKAIVGHVGVSPWLGQEVGFSGYYGDYDGAGNVLSGFGVDTFNTYGPFELITEYAYFGAEDDGTDLANWFQGAYAQVNYHFWPEFLDETFLGRGFDDPTFTLSGRYGWASISDDNDSTTGTNEETRFTVGLNYRPIENFVVKFEYQNNDTDNEALEAGNGDGFVTSVAMGF